MTHWRVPFGLSRDNTVHSCPSAEVSAPSEVTSLSSCPRWVSHKLTDHFPGASASDADKGVPVAAARVRACKLGTRASPSWPGVSAAPAQEARRKEEHVLSGPEAPGHCVRVTSVCPRTD